MLKALRQLRPQDTVADHFYAIATHQLCTATVAQQIALASKREGAPTYAYRFSAGLSWNGGARKALHALDVPFCFDTVDAAKGELDPTLDPGGRPLSATMRSAWASFASIGVPVQANVPNWPTNTTEQPRRMVLAEKCAISEEDDAEGRQIASILSSW